MGQTANRLITAKGFWTPGNKDNPVYQGLLFGLIASEAFEALAEHRNGKPGWQGRCQDELADVIVRTVDIAYALGFNLDHAVAGKLVEDNGRPHMHGKRY